MTSADWGFCTHEYGMPWEKPEMAAVYGEFEPGCSAGSHLYLLIL